MRQAFFRADFDRWGTGLGPALVAIACTAACTSPLPLDGLPCPCAEGYLCCPSTNRCLVSIEACPNAPRDGASDDVSSVPLDGNEPASDARGDGPIDTVAEQGGGPKEDASLDGAWPDVATDAPPDGRATDALAVDAPDASLGDVPDVIAVDAPDFAGIDADGSAPIADASDAPPDAGPRWQTVGDFGDAIVLAFDLGVAADGTPYVGLSKLTPPGRARVSLVFRYDGTAWQQVGANQVGTEEFAFALAPDATPYIVTTTTVRTFQQGQWQALPDVGGSVFPPVQFPSLGIDRSGRLHAIVFDTSTGANGVARWNGTSWEILGAPDSLGTNRLPMYFGFDATSVYVAIDDSTNFQTTVRRFDGTTWSSVGGGPMLANRGAFAVTKAGTAYLSFEDASRLSTYLTPPTPWGQIDSLLAYTGGLMVMPASDVDPDDDLFVAYLADRDPGPDVVPGPVVSRANGAHFTELGTDGLDPSLFDAIRLRVARTGTRDVPYVGYVRGQQLVVKKYE